MTTTLAAAGGRRAEGQDPRRRPARRATSCRRRPSSSRSSGCRAPWCARRSPGCAPRVWSKPSRAVAHSCSRCPSRRRSPWSPRRIRTHRDVLDMIDFRLGRRDRGGRAGRRPIDAAGRTAIRGAGGVRRGRAGGRRRGRLPISPAVAAASWQPLLPGAARLTRADDDHAAPHAARRRVLAHRRRRTSTGSSAEHDNIAAAVLAGDPDTARAAMRVHLGNTRRRLDAGGR